LSFNSHVHSIWITFLNFTNQQLFEQTCLQWIDTTLNGQHIGLGHHVAEDSQETGVELAAAVDIESLFSVLFECGKGGEHLWVEVSYVTCPCVYVAIYYDCVDQTKSTSVYFVVH